MHLWISRSLVFAVVSPTGCLWTAPLPPTRFRVKVGKVRQRRRLGVVPDWPPSRMRPPRVQVYGQRPDWLPDLVSRGSSPVFSSERPMQAPSIARSARAGFPEPQGVGLAVGRRDLGILLTQP